MLEIVCGQRDRYKARLSDVERENDRLTKQIESARSELQNLRADNVKLYEKIRYLQSYGDISRKGGLTDIEKQATTHKDDELEVRTHSPYGSRMGPLCS